MLVAKSNTRMVSVRIVHLRLYSVRGMNNDQSKDSENVHSGHGDVQSHRSILGVVASANRRVVSARVVVA